MSPPRFDLGLDAGTTCTGCKRPRLVPEAGRTVASGEGVVVVRTSEKCLQCGDDRVSIRPRVKME